MNVNMYRAGREQAAKILLALGLLVTFRISPAVVFFVFSMMMTVAGTFVTPPFQVPDEPAHFLRAIQVAQGGLRGTLENGQSGGRVPASVLPVLHIFDDLPFHAERKAAPDRIDRISAVGWSETRTLTAFPNTVTYGPAGYLPQAAAILTGRLLHLSVIHTFYLARLVNGAAFAVLGSLAIALCRRGKTLLLLLLALPMTGFLAASLSQDGLLIALSAVLAALLTRHMPATCWTWKHWTLLGIGFGVASMAKPPGLALSVAAVLVAGRRDWRQALLCPVIATGLTFAWLKGGVAPVKIQFLTEKGVSDSGQMHWLFTHPAQVPGLIRHTVSAFRDGFQSQFIGVFGWLDTALPAWFYLRETRILKWVFLLSFLAPFTWQGGRAFAEGALRRAGIFLLTALSCAGIFISLYVIWTPVGAPLIDGIQGRYFLPSACFLVLLFPARREKAAGQGSVIVSNAIVYAVSVWLLITLVVYSHTLTTRFW